MNDEISHSVDEEPDYEEPDYEELIDQQTWAFIKSTEAAFPAEAATADPSQQRELYDKMCQVFRKAYPPGIETDDFSIIGNNGRQIPVRRYTSKYPSATQRSTQLVYLHGGGFVVGGLESHDDVCAEICSLTLQTLVSVDYRLAPEHRHPAAIDDVLNVLNYLHKKYDQPIVICGDSAGANLSAAASHIIRNTEQTGDQLYPEIVGQVLIYPGLGGNVSQGSYVLHSNAPMLSTADVQHYSEVRSSSDTDKLTVAFAPLLDTDYSGLPPTVAFSAQCDPLSDDGKLYCQLIQQAGGKACWYHEDGLVHGYLRARHSVDRAAQSFDRIIDAISALAQRSWPYV